MSPHANLLAHLMALIGERHPFSAPEKLLDVERYLMKQFGLLHLTVETHSFEAFGRTYRNVIGTAGSQQQASPLIVAAHYDTVERSPGADDNASGLAVLLDVAQRITQGPFIRPVQFVAFCLEEEDLLGSRAYVADLVAARRPVHGAIVLECVGFARDEEGSQKIPSGIPITVPTVGNFLAVVGNHTSTSLALAVEQSMKTYLQVISLMMPGNGEFLPDTRRSDHTAFWEAGFPAVMLTDTANFRNPHYHRPSDTLETLNLDFLTSVDDGVTSAVLELAGHR